MSDLILLPVPYTDSEQIEARISNFRKSLMSGDQDLAYCCEILDIIIDYIGDFEDEDPRIDEAFKKLQEAGFWLDSVL